MVHIENANENYKSTHYRNSKMKVNLSDADYYS